MNRLAHCAVWGGLLLAQGCATWLPERKEPARTADYPIQPVSFTAVQIDGGFWGARLGTCRKVTIPYCFKKCEETGRISNFAKAGGLAQGPFEGIYFNDSDVYKVVEGAAYALQIEHDPELDAYLDDLIAKIAAAQEEDGYLYTIRTIDPKNVQEGCGPERWSNLQSGHELYCAGHMYEAAVAHFQATGKRSLLDVAIKNADLLVSVFGPGKRQGVPGHEEIEIGLAKLYRATGKREYLDLAKRFLDARGRPGDQTRFNAQIQAHKPVVKQKEAVGHAVRAGYLYSGMADVAALTGDRSYVRAVDRIWRDVVSKKLYVTGGVGASPGGEAFGDAYELPNQSAYNETCAAVANALWNHRMFLLRGDARYVDVLERVLYNGFLAGVSLSGDRFFYTNPLAADGFCFPQGTDLRKEWFGCACCPVNVARFVPSVGGMMYARRGNAVYVNLFANSRARIDLGGRTVALLQETRYPWDSRVRIVVEPARAHTFTLKLRIPGWARGKPVPSRLYRYLGKPETRVEVKVNGKPLALELEKGYVSISRQWRKGDTIDLNLPMPVRRVISHRRVKADDGRVALERGPIVYCAEAIDNGRYVRNLVVPDDAPLHADCAGDFLGGLAAIRGRVARRTPSDGDADEIPTQVAEFTAIPYYAWAHRGEGEMAVWLPRDPALARPAPRPTVAATSRPSASHAHSNDSLGALLDQVEPAASGDVSIPRFTWWDHRGGREWVQYEFNERRTVSSVEVYWFDDTGKGKCRAPKSWRLLYRDGEEWKPVDNAGPYGAAKDRYNKETFKPVNTDALRIDAELRAEFSAGILEWRVQ